MADQAEFVNHNHSLGRGHPNALGRALAAFKESSNKLQQFKKSMHEELDPAKAAEHIKMYNDILWGPEPALKVSKSKVVGLNAEFRAGGGARSGKGPYADNPKSIGGRSPSLKWPHLFDLLVAKGYDQSKAAAISNSRVWTRKNGALEGLPWNKAKDPKALKGVANAYAKKHGVRASAAPLTFVNHNHTPGRGHPSAARSFTVITADQARGNSRPVSHQEFQRLAGIGQKKLDAMKAHSSPTTGLDAQWEKIKAETYAKVKEPWGGATIDAHTGKEVAQGAHAYALTVKDQGVPTVSIHENATRAEFNAAMEQAKKSFDATLQREQHHLGVFHDDENHRIDIDPVIVVTKLSDVETIGAASHAIGGAYNFADGNGYWPPHVEGS